ncbi:MAG: hypothetical protein AAB964_00190 [Patescibacteria group bacterium]
MRVFFAIDDRSTIRAEVVRQLLVLQVPRQSYEVLPLESSRFPVRRTEVAQLLNYAKYEAQKVLEHYSDVSRCIVIVGAQLPDSTNSAKTLPVDYVLILRRGGQCDYRPVNPRNVHNHLWASSPGLQPELAETVIELGEIEPLR